MIDAAGHPRHHPRVPEFLNGITVQTSTCEFIVRHPDRAAPGD